MKAFEHVETSFLLGDTYFHILRHYCRNNKKAHKLCFAFPELNVIFENNDKAICYYNQH